MAVTYGAISGAEPSTVTFQVETVVIDHNGTNVQREILVLGSPQTSNALQAVVAAPPVSTEFGGVVRIASGPSSAADLLVRPVFSSTTADNPVTATIAGAAVSSAAPAGNSSALVVRIAGGPSSAVDLVVRPVFSSTGADNPVSVSAFPANSSQVEVRALPAGSSQVEVRALPANSSQVEVRALPANSSQVEVRNSPTVIIGTNLQSTAAPAPGSSGLVVRPVIPSILTAASSNAFGTSTSFSIASSGAGVANYVTAYSITCTNATATKLAFYSGSSMNWPVILQAVSSAIAGANLAVSAPAYLFKTNQAETFSLNMGGSSVAGFKVAVSYFRAP